MGLSALIRERRGNDFAQVVHGAMDNWKRVDPEVCVHVQRQRMRASCRLAGVDRLLKTDLSLEAAMEACRHTDSLEQHCLVHLPACREAQ